MSILDSIRKDVVVIDANKLISTVNDQSYGCQRNHHNKAHPINLLFQTQKQIRQTNKSRNDKILLEICQRKTSSITIEQIVEDKPKYLKQNQKHPHQRLSYRKTHYNRLAINVEKQRSLP